MGEPLNFAQTLERFLAALRPFPGLLDDLNPGCDDDDLRRAERDLGVVLPADFAAFYRAHDGQRGRAVGIFKALSGHSKSSRPRFLPLADAARSRETLATGGVLEPAMIPFAVDDIDAPDDVIVLHAGTGEVFLLWTAAPDPFMPADWQTACMKRGESLGDFLLGQAALY